MSTDHFKVFSSVVLLVNILEHLVYTDSTGLFAITPCLNLAISYKRLVQSASNDVIDLSTLFY